MGNACEILFGNLKRRRYGGGVGGHAETDVVIVSNRNTMNMCGSA